MLTSASSPDSNMCGVCSMTLRASTIGFLTRFNSVTAPQRASLVMTLASSSWWHLRVSTLPLPVHVQMMALLFVSTAVHCRYASEALCFKCSVGYEHALMYVHVVEGACMRRKGVEWGPHVRS